MQVINYTEFRNNLKHNLDNVCDSKDIVVVARGQNKNVVIISLEEYNSWKETEYLNRSESNRQRLNDAIQRSAAGNIQLHSLIEE